MLDERKKYGNFINRFLKIFNPTSGQDTAALHKLARRDATHAMAGSLEENGHSSHVYRKPPENASEVIENLLNE